MNNNFNSTLHIFVRQCKALRPGIMLFFFLFCQHHFEAVVAAPVDYIDVVLLVLAQNLYL